VEGYDCIVMKHIIHDWPDSESIKILKNCRKVLSPGNKLFIIDIVLDRNNHFYKDQISLDLMMMVHLSARERYQIEFERLLVEAGFKIEAINQVPYENVIQAIAV
jgi:2-polyprenyl-3-methyl-5-hydroxy-6-metoxy-1,4-benzoquinol methylase